MLLQYNCQRLTLVMCFVFVFAALLEYAAVNYTYWGARAKKKKKEKKMRVSSTIDLMLPQQEIFYNKSLLFSLLLI